MSDKGKDNFRQRKKNKIKCIRFLSVNWSFRIDTLVYEAENKWIEPGVLNRINFHAKSNSFKFQFITVN